jgi:hypothetical protein
MYYRIVKGGLTEAMRGHGDIIGIVPDLTLANMRIESDIEECNLDRINTHTTSEGNQITRALDTHGVRVYYHTFAVEGDMR